MKIKKAFIIIIITTLAFSQTRPKLFELKPPVSTAVTFIGFVNNAQGVPTIVKISLGAGLTLTPTIGGYTLDAVASIPIQKQTDSFIGTASLTFTLSHTPNNPPIVTRNGLVQAIIVDYTLSGKTLTFLATTGIASDDLVLVIYDYVQGL